MALITATWRVTLLGVVLLDWDDYMESEPEVTPEGDVQMTPLVDAVSPFIQGRGNLRHTITFSQVRVFETDAMARDFLLEHIAEVPLCRAAAPCVIEVLRGGVATLNNAVLAGCGRPTTSNDRFKAQYTILGGALKWAPTDAVVDDDGTPVGDDDDTVITGDT